ncbi:MAG: hypothetical protein KDN18_09530 [Verrucomicrobiae bacterium]|nr:hypothetical protein [Verrucomicrobiae bacterium]
MTLAVIAIGWGGILLAAPREVHSGEEGLVAFDEFLEGGGLGPDEKILGMVGFCGQALPAEWLFLTGKPDDFGAGLRESVFAQGKILAERTLKVFAGQDLPHLPIERGRLKVTTANAYETAVARAKDEKVSFKSVRYQLRVRDAGNEPVWLISFLNRAQVGIGVVYVSAETGEVLRENWRVEGGKRTDSDNPSKITSR